MAHQRIGTETLQEREIKQKSTGCCSQLLGQPAPCAAGSVITGNLLNKLPYPDAGFSRPLKNKEVQAEAVKETALPDEHKKALPKGLMGRRDTAHHTRGERGQSVGTAFTLSVPGASKLTWKYFKDLLGDKARV